MIYFRKNSIVNFVYYGKTRMHHWKKCIFSTFNFKGLVLNPCFCLWNNNVKVEWKHGKEATRVLDLITQSQWEQKSILDSMTCDFHWRWGDIWFRLESGIFIHFRIFESVLIQGHRDPDDEEEPLSRFHFHPASPTINDSIWIEFLTQVDLYFSGTIEFFLHSTFALTLLVQLVQLIKPCWSYSNESWYQ